MFYVESILIINDHWGKDGSLEIWTEFYFKVRIVQTKILKCIKYKFIKNI